MTSSRHFYDCRPGVLVKGARANAGTTSVARHDPLTGALAKVLQRHARQIAEKVRVGTPDLEEACVDVLLDAVEHVGALHASRNASSTHPRGYGGCVVELVASYLNAPLQRIAGHTESARVDLPALLKTTGTTTEICTTMEKTTFTKELKAPAPASRASLGKLLRTKLPPAARSNLNEAASLIKAVHRSGGERLHKAEATRPGFASAPPIADDRKLEKIAAPTPGDWLRGGLLGPGVQARLDREIAGAAVKACHAGHRLFISNGSTKP